MLLMGRSQDSFHDNSVCITLMYPINLEWTQAHSYPCKVVRMPPLFFCI